LEKIGIQTLNAENLRKATETHQYFNEYDGVDIPIGMLQIYGVYTGIVPFHQGTYGTKARLLIAKELS
jgi:hypothetical protein